MQPEAHNFVGVFPTDVKPQYQLRAIRDLFESAPSFRTTALVGMENGEERIHQEVPFVGKPITGGEASVFRRRIDNTSYHGITVALAANSLADFMKLSSQERNLFVTAAGLHDSSKVLELELMGYRELSQQKGLKNWTKNIVQLPRARSILRQTLKKAGVLETIPFREIVRTIGKLTAMEFTEYFDQKINLAFLNSVLTQSGEFQAPEEHRAMLTVASADSVGQIPALIARAVYFADKLSVPESESIQTVRALATTLKDRGGLPSIEESMDKTNLLAMALLLCDGISQGDKLRTVDDRIDEAIQRGQYTELDEQSRNLYGTTFFEANRIAMHAAETIFTHIAIQNGLLSEETPTQDLPKAIFNRILVRADARLSQD